jgi:hypothetical protein
VARRRLREAAPRFVSLTRTHGTLLIAETAKTDVETFTIRLEARTWLLLIVGCIADGLCVRVCQTVGAPGITACA